MLVVHLLVRRGVADWVMAWVAIVLTVVVAALSYRFVETPARRWRARRVSAAR
jgi:peptidoglycan/LPS O-acetylase OafA/YrhL